MFLIIRFQVVGLHNYPLAEGDHVYLLYPHRHVFHFEAHIKVDGLDREVEFFAARNMLIDTVFEIWPKRENDKAVSFGADSCEKIANTLVEEVIYRDAYLGARIKRLSVMEDNENGACWEKVV